MNLPRSVEEVRQLLRRREVSAVDLAERTIQSIDEREPELNAFITVTRELALEQAAAVDRALAAGVDPGPLGGVPVAVKDAIAVAGVACTGGSSLLCDHVPSVDAELVVRLRRAGAVLVGKTNMSELGWGLDAALGRVNNPLDVSVTAGGSSGGSAAAVASGSLPIAVGTDGGGSIRLPAAFCAVVGMKPTHGLLPSDGSLPGATTLTDAGPIGRTIADARALFHCLAGRASLPVAPKRPTLALLDGAAADCHTEIEEVYGNAIAALALECTTTTTDLDLAGTGAAWFETIAAEMAASLGPFLGTRAGLVSPDLRRLLEIGNDVRATDYLDAQRFRAALTAQIDSALEGVDALVTPTAPSPPLKDDLEWDDDEFFGNPRWTVLANLTGHPAISLPVPGARVPTGLQLIGRRGEDARLLAVASRVESALAAITPTAGRSEW